MNTVRIAVIAAVAAALFAPAPAAQASELVKLARLIVTGKRTPTTPAPEPKAAAPQAPAAARVEASPAPSPAPVFEVPDADTSPRLELPRQDRQGGGERVGGGPVRGHAG